MGTILMMHWTLLLLLSSHFLRTACAWTVSCSRSLSGGRLKGHRPLLANKGSWYDAGGAGDQGSTDVELKLSVDQAVEVGKRAGKALLELQQQVAVNATGQLAAWKLQVDQVLKELAGESPLHSVLQLDRSTVPLVNWLNVTQAFGDMAGSRNGSSGAKSMSLMEQSLVDLERSLLTMQSELTKNYQLIQEDVTYGQAQLLDKIRLQQQQLKSKLQLPPQQPQIDWKWAERFAPTVSDALGIDLGLATSADNVTSPQAIMSMMVSHSLLQLSRYEPSDIVFYNTPPWHINEIPGDFSLALPPAEAYAELVAEGQQRLFQGGASDIGGSGGGGRSQAQNLLIDNAKALFRGESSVKVGGQGEYVNRQWERALQLRQAMQLLHKQGAVSEPSNGPLRLKRGTLSFQNWRRRRKEPEEERKEEEEEGTSSENGPTSGVGESVGGTKEPERASDGGLSRGDNSLLDSRSWMSSSTGEDSAGNEMEELAKKWRSSAKETAAKFAFRDTVKGLKEQLNQARQTKPSSSSSTSSPSASSSSPQSLPLKSVEEVKTVVERKLQEVSKATASAQYEVLRWCVQSLLLEHEVMEMLVDDEDGGEKGGEVGGVDDEIDAGDGSNGSSTEGSVARGALLTADPNPTSSPASEQGGSGIDDAVSAADAAGDNAGDNGTDGGDVGSGDTDEEGAVMMGAVGDGDDDGDGFPQPSSRGFDSFLSTMSSLPSLSPFLLQSSVATSQSSPSASSAPFARHWRDALAILKRTACIGHHYRVNYPLLLHSAALAALAPYNLKLKLLKKPGPFGGNGLTMGAMGGGGGGGGGAAAAAPFPTLNSMLSKLPKPAVGDKEKASTGQDGSVLPSSSRDSNNNSESEQRKREETFEYLVRKAMGQDGGMGKGDMPHADDDAGGGGGGDGGDGNSGMVVKTITSDKACAVMIHCSGRNTTIVSFRGTKDAPIDLLTDATVVAAQFVPRRSFTGNEGGTANDGDSGAGGVSGVGRGNKMAVHMGFLLAFRSLCLELEPLLDQATRDGSRVMFTGHSMGGALAQIAAAYFADLCPTLITFAAPAIGNDAFCKHLEQVALPYGGLRCYNTFDPVPPALQLVGYKHAGVPLKQELSAKAVELFQRRNINTQLPGLALIAPHILFSLGPCVYSFPVLGTETAQDVRKVQV